MYVELYWLLRIDGGYMLVDIESNSVAAGSRFELSLDDVEAFLK